MMVFLQDASLDDEGLKSGDLLLIEAGRLPPKVILWLIVMSRHFLLFINRGL